LGLHTIVTAVNVGEHLDTLGIRHLAEWDVLYFIYHHGANLAGAERIASLLGYSRFAVGAALDVLTSEGLVFRSRNSRGVRLYQFAVTDPGDSRQHALEQLMKLTEGRSGRLLIIGRLRQPVSPKERRGRGGLHLA
jgi:DNA-binding MarR family transcriptional regulator